MAVVEAAVIEGAFAMPATTHARGCHCKFTNGLWGPHPPSAILPPPPHLQSTCPPPPQSTPQLFLPSSAPRHNNSTTTTNRLLLPQQQLPRAPRATLHPLLLLLLPQRRHRCRHPRQALAQALWRLQDGCRPAGEAHAGPTQLATGCKDATHHAAQLFSRVLPQPITHTYSTSQGPSPLLKRHAACSAAPSEPDPVRVTSHHEQ